MTAKLIVNYQGNKKRLVLSTFTALFLLQACSLHNINFNAAPTVTPQQTYPSLGPIENSPENRADLWWYNFEKPALNDLIEQSFATNLDMQAAAARIQQARALQTQTRSLLFPSIQAEGNITDRFEDNNDQPSTREIGAAMRWEIDIFNRIGSAALADEYIARAQEESLKALRLSLSAEIANAYFGAVEAHNQLQLLSNQLETDNDLLELIQLRQDNGVGTNVEVLQQRSQVAESRSLIPQAETDLRVFENRLDVLLGVAPDGQDRIAPEENLSFAPDLPPLGVPVDLILNRPDLRAAQAELVAADADIASAIAERLPQLTLEGGYFYSDTTAFTGPVGILVGSFVQPLLDWGLRKAEVERNRALYTERLALFTRQYLEAVEDVENALYQERKQREYIARLEERRQILQDTVEETEALYTQGVNDYLPVLNALQILRDVERDLVTENANLIRFRIALHRAIGGATTIPTE